MDLLYIQPHFPFLQVSILGYGCMGLTGIYNNPLPEEEGSKVLKEAFNRGVTFFDTVDVYGVQHANEILVGKVIVFPYTKQQSYINNLHEIIAM